MTLDYILVIYMCFSAFVFILPPPVYQILGWQQALDLCTPQEVFNRLLARVKALANGLASPGNEDKRTGPGNIK